MALILRKDKAVPLTTAELDGNFIYLQSELNGKASSAQLANKVDKVDGMGLSQESFTSAEKAKLASTEIYTSAEKTKLAGLEGSHFRGTFVSLAALKAGVTSPIAGDYADVDAGQDSDAVRYIWDVSDNKWVASGSAAPVTAAQVKQLYESNPDTNAFTNAQKTKLAGIADNATKNQTDSFLLNRANHTGSQPANTITGLQPAALTRIVIRSGSLNTMGVPGLYMVIPTSGPLEGSPVFNGVPRTSGYLDITTSTEPLNGVVMTQQVWHAHLNSQKWTRWLVANGTAWTDWAMSLFEGDFGITGKLSKVAAGTNANNLPEYTHRIWLGSDSVGGPIADQHWVIDHRFLQTGYAVQQAQQLGAEYPGVYTRSQANGVWSDWKQAAASGGGAGLPVGSLVPWHVSEASLPAGHIPANGQLVNRAMFPDLWALVAPVASTDAQWLGDVQRQAGWSSGDGSTTFRMPDLNGKGANSQTEALFLRGYGRNSSGSASKYQADQFQGHSFGGTDGWSLAEFGTYPSAGSTVANLRAAYHTLRSNPYPASTISKIQTDGTNGTPRVGLETRPANVAVIWCFIGGVQPVNIGTVDIAATAAQVANHNSSIQNLQAAVTTTVTNANGTATKFSDGTMICRHTLATNLVANIANGALWMSPSVNYTFPVPFVSVPTLSMAGSANAVTVGWQVSETAPTATTTGSIRWLSPAQNAGGAVGYIAIGRWF